MIETAATIFKTIRRNLIEHIERKKSEIKRNEEQVEMYGNALQRSKKELLEAELALRLFEAANFPVVDSGVPTNKG